MDGTLLRKDFTISPENVSAVRRLGEAGVVFAVATGRTYYDAMSICGRYDLKPYVISNNGTCAFSPDGELIYARPIARATAAEVIRCLEAEKACFGIGTSDHYIAPENWEQTLDDEIADLRERDILITEDYVDFIKEEMLAQHGIRYIASTDELFEETNAIYSISLMIADQEKLHRIKNRLERIPSLLVSISGKHNAEIIEKRGTKDQALRCLCANLNTDLDEAAAIGDSLNDLEMIREAGIGIAVGNARKEVLDAADMVVADHLENGVAQAVDRLLCS